MEVKIDADELCALKQESGISTYEGLTAVKWAEHFQFTVRGLEIEIIEKDERIAELEAELVNTSGKIRLLHDDLRPYKESAIRKNARITELEEKLNTARETSKAMAGGFSHTAHMLDAGKLKEKDERIAELENLGRVIYSGKTAKEWSDLHDMEAACWRLRITELEKKLKTINENIASCWDDELKKMVKEKDERIAELEKGLSTSEDDREFWQLKAEGHRRMRMWTFDEIQQNLDGDDRLPLDIPPSEQ